MNTMDDTSDDALVRAIRKRLLDEIGQHGDTARIVNNVYGGSIPSGQVGQAGGVMGALGGGGGGGDTGGAPPGEDPYEYFVDILRKDLPEKDPDTGKPIGWEKSVRRYRNPKKKVTAETF